ncbi:hypothetical protein [Methanofollis ethanolicus]|uniref:hypothetical protein n=1 Tax=Methanofollis ethanolicus TaxID=488124 RepID=UPI00082B981B|nr:hypothetical protein [Methanofollis ethanolicus]
MYRINRPFLASLLALTLVLPVNIYCIGNVLGAGLQFPLFRYQQTYLGTSLIFLTRDLDYVTTGILAGRTALSICLGVVGTLLLIAAITFLIIRWQEEYEAARKILSLLLAGAGVAYLASCVAQYGPLFHGPAGFCIPIGVPLIFGVAWWAYNAGEDDESGGAGDLPEPESDEVPSGDSR